MKIGRMISLSWFGGTGSQDVIAKQVSGLHQKTDGLWLCVERDGGSPNPGTQLIALNLDQRDDLQLSQLFYEECLTPLFHHLRKGFSFNQHHYQAYRRWNKGLAEALSALYREGDVLWLHDAHWIPVARYLKQIQPNLPIGISFSSSFCGSEVFDTLPVAKEVLEDLLYFDLINFARDSDIQSFTCSMTTIMGAVTLADKRLKKGNQIIKVAAYPSVTAIDEALLKTSVDLPFGMASSDKLILSVDIPSWFSNRTNRNQAYELFLNDNSSLAKDIVFGSMITPFSISADRIRNLLKRWQSDLADLNEQWRSYSRKPFRMAQCKDTNVYVPSLYRQAKVFIDLSLGCYASGNLNEFWSAQDIEDPGVLIVSKLAIDGNDLKGAIVVHPLDVVGVSQAIKQALLMPLSERKLRYDQLGMKFRSLSPERLKAKFTFDVVDQSRKNRQANVMSAQREVRPGLSHHV